ncbi:MAG: NAD(P)-dependent oxidoreductase [Chloroherpetonaceae bacterium]|nr:NAD(P)-dependent oxidoreductase [Chloroherpetonaceae bacterium]
MNGKVFITDYIQTPDLESKILGNILTNQPSVDVEVLLVWHEIINQDYCKRFPNLKGVVRYGVGYDSLDLNYLAKNKIIACNTPDYGTDEVSDTAVSMITGIARGIYRYDNLARTFREDSWQENTIKSLKRNSETTIGFLGAGRIGGNAVLKCNSLKFKTAIYDPFKERGYEKLLNTMRVDELEELLSISEIISIHLPLNNDTKGMINESFISKMKHGSSIVNTARGAIVSDIDIFYDALKSGQLNSVYLDVLPEEPPKRSKLIDAWRNREDWLDGRLIINPHSAYYSKEAYYEMRTKAALNALRIIENKKPFNILSIP